jgi:hypothetical protein
MTSSGIEPATFRLAAYCLNQPKEKPREEFERKFHEHLHGSVPDCTEALWAAGTNYVRTLFVLLLP